MGLRTILWSLWEWVQTAKEITSIFMTMQWGLQKRYWRLEPLHTISFTAYVINLHSLGRRMCEVPMATDLPM